MKCTRCSAEIPAQSQFCLRCGLPLRPGAGASAAGPPAAAIPQPAQNNRALVIVSGILALALIALLAFVGYGYLTQKPSNAGGGQLVQAPGAPGAGTLVQAPANPGSGASIQAPAEPTKSPLTAPAQKVNTSEIDDYLRFVKGCEDQKMTITRKQLADTLANYAGQLGKQAEAATDDQKSKDYLPSVSRDSAQYDKQWDDLVKYFNTRTPPSSCVELHDKYYAYLGKTEGMFVKLSSALAEAQSDPNKALQSLTGMQGAASAEADAAARSADDALYDICKKYGLRKEFDIKTDPSSSSGMLR